MSFIIRPRSIAFCLLLAAALATTAGCTTNAATGRSQFNSMSTADEIALGEQAMPELVKEYGGAVNDAQLQRYVSDIGRKLAANTEANSPSLPWEFTLLDSDIVNAFSLPGGKVFLSRALMSKMTNEAQLAGVIGHEIGHVTAQHVDERIGEQKIAGVAVGIAGIGTRHSDNRFVNILPVIVGSGFLLKFSRDQESEADSLGMRYMRRAGYDPAAQLQVMRILKSEQQQSGGGAGFEMFATHPLPQTRIDRIKQLLQTNFAATQNNPDYQLYEDRFNSIARPRLDALEKKN